MTVSQMYTLLAVADTIASELHRGIMVAKRPCLWLRRLLFIGRVAIANTWPLAKVLCLSLFPRKTAPPGFDCISSIRGSDFRASWSMRLIGMSYACVKRPRREDGLRGTFLDATPRTKASSNLSET